MNFKDNKAIYLQIADRISDQILSETLTAEGKVPSVRELAAEIEVKRSALYGLYPSAALLRCGLSGLCCLIIPDRVLNRFYISCFLNIKPRRIRFDFFG